MSDDSGELFIKPCTPAEVQFYQSANRRHPEFADLMPLFMGTLSLSDPANVDIANEAAAVVADDGLVNTGRDEIAALVAEAVAHAPPREDTPSQGEYTPSWTPKSSSKK